MSTPLRTSCGGVDAAALPGERPDGLNRSAPDQRRRRGSKDRKTWHSPSSTPSRTSSALRGAGASISPDGTRMAFLGPWRTRLNIWVRDLEPGSEPRPVTADETRSVQSFEWADDPRRLLHLQDDGGEQRWYLHRADLDTPGSEAVDLTPFPGTTVLGFAPSPVRPGKVTLLLNTRDLGTFDPHELDAPVPARSGARPATVRGRRGRGARVREPREPDGRVRGRRPLHRPVPGRTVRAEPTAAPPSDWSPRTAPRPVRGADRFVPTAPYFTEPPHQLARARRPGHARPTP